MRVALLLFILLLAFPSLASAALVNINTASVAQLETLKGIGPSKASAIIDYRTAHGPFTRIEDIQEVKGIGPSTYAGIQSSITVDTTAAQPSIPPASSKKVQESITSTSTTHEEVIAPTVALQVAAVGAVPGPFSSVWTWIGLVSVLLLAGAAFILF